MDFYNFLKNGSLPLKKSVIAISAMSGAINMVLVSVIMFGASKATPGALQMDMVLMTGICMIVFYISKHFSLVRITLHVEAILNDTRKRITNKIQRTNLHTYEGVGNSVFYTTLTTDIQMISQGSSQIINTLGSVIMVLAGSVALFIVSMQAFLIALLLLAICIFYYRAMRKKLIAEIQETTEKENEFFTALNDLLMGFKELKLSQAKAKDFYIKSLHKHSDEVCELKCKSSQRLSRAMIISQMFMYVILAAVVFILPNISNTGSDVIMKASALLLFLTAPIIDVVSGLSVFELSNQSIHNILNLERRLDKIGDSEGVDDITKITPKPPRPFNTLACRDATFSYRDGNGSSFSLGPVNFELNNNDIVFIVGGNGSGKSTFLKLFTSLYLADEGSVLWDEKVVGAKRVPLYRNLFAPIFTDFHLFDRLYGVKGASQERIDDLLDEMNLNDVTDILGDGRITKRDLSTGQKKRLSLIISILEDKPVFLFDEVAADQDPYFRKYFYETIIPNLKAQGKTVLAVTHDDKYFPIADKVYKMDYGKLVPYEA